MDHRCPHCGTAQTKQKFGQSLITRMSLECAHCGKAIKLNVHRLEQFVVLFNFIVIILLALLAYRLHSREWGVAAVVFALAGSGALPLLERTLLRDWPRYVAAD